MTSRVMLLLGLCLVCAVLLISCRAVKYEELSNAELTRLASSNDPLAQYQLGVRYHEGEGADQNYVEALKWFNLAADQGSVLAQGMTAWMYLEGEGVTKNEKEGFKRCKLAAEKGYSLAQQLLGNLYYKGHGTAQNVEQAYFWSVIAHTTSDSISAELQELKENSAGELSFDSRAKVERNAFEYLKMKGW